MIRVGCVGCGAWGKNLLRVWNETDGAQLVAVARSDAARLGQVLEQYPSARGFATSEELVADPSIDLVSIATPPSTHYEIARQALLAGKHVFVEKPMCLDPGEARALAELADETGRVVMVGHLMEHSGPVPAIREVIDSGRLGELRHMHFQRLKLGRVRREENVLWSFAPHDLSIASYWLQRVPRTVQAVGHCYIQPDVEDIVFMDCWYEDGVSLHVHVSWLHPESVRKVVVVGSSGMVIWDDMASGQKVHFSASGIGTDLGNIESETEPVVYSATQPLQAECASLIYCIESGQRPVNDAWDGVRVVEMLAAADRSLQTNQPSTLT